MFRMFSKPEPEIEPLRRDLDDALRCCAEMAKFAQAQYLINKKDMAELSAIKLVLATHEAAIVDLSNRVTAIESRFVGNRPRMAVVQNNGTPDGAA